MNAHTEQAIDESQYITVKEVAKFLGCSDDTVRRIIKDEDLEAIVVRGMYRINRTSFQDYLEKHRVRKNKKHKKNR